jgi:hypothetical protein
MSSGALLSMAITPNKIIALVVLVVVIAGVGFFMWSRSKKSA